MSEQNNNKGCGCANIPISVILLFLGGSGGYLYKYGAPDIYVHEVNSLLAKVPGVEIQIPIGKPPLPPTPTPSLPSTSLTSSPKLPTTDTTNS